MLKGSWGSLSLKTIKENVHTQSISFLCLCVCEYSYWKIIRFRQKHIFKKNKWIILLISTFSQRYQQFVKKGGSESSFPLLLLLLLLSISQWVSLRRNFHVKREKIPWLCHIRNSSFEKNPVFTTFSLLIVLHKNHRVFFFWGGGRTEKRRGWINQALFIIWKVFRQKFLFWTSLCWILLRSFFVFTWG